MLPSLPTYADKDTVCFLFINICIVIIIKVNILIARQGFHPIDIRIIRRATDSGIPRVFGFVEFSDTNQAETWIKYNQVW